MAKRPVKVAGYVRTRRKGQSVITTMVRPYQRARPGIAATGGTTMATDVPFGSFGGGKTVLSAHLADGRDMPPVPNTVLGTDETRWLRVPQPERHVVEGVVRYLHIWQEETDYEVIEVGPDSIDADSLTDVIQRLDGHRVRVTVEVLE